MQVTCPQCTTRLQLSAAKLPSQPFSIQCPKCQFGFTVSPSPSLAEAPPAPTESLPDDELLDIGEKPAPVATDAPLSSPPAPSAAAPTAPTAPLPETLAQKPTPTASFGAQTDWNAASSAAAIGWTNSMPAPTVADDSRLLVTSQGPNYDLVQVLTSLLGGGSLNTPKAPLNQVRRRAIVACLANAEDLNKVRMALQDQPYELTEATSPEQVTALLQTSHQLDILLLDPNFHASQQGGATIMRYLNMLNPARRRRVFVVVTSHSYRTLDMQAAFTHGVNLVINSNELDALPSALTKSIQEFNSLYRAFNEASGTNPF